MISPKKNAVRFKTSNQTISSLISQSSVFSYSSNYHLSTGAAKQALAPKNPDLIS